MPYPAVPSLPTLATPAACPSPCTTCFVAQNKIQISGITAPGCAAANGIHDFWFIDRGSGYCRWVYTDGVSIRWVYSISIWEVRLNGGSGDMQVFGSISCDGDGKLRGSGSFTTLGSTTCVPGGEVGTVTMIP